MKKSIRKATFIIRLWTEGDPADDDVWRGTAEHIGSSQSCQFQTLDEFFVWLHHELAITEEEEGES
jgi:hypothetical protein